MIERELVKYEKNRERKHKVNVILSSKIFKKEGNTDKELSSYVFYHFFLFFSKL